MKQDETAETIFDVVVIGSGAGGLAAAVTAQKHGLTVCIVEKESQFGGTTARSGGVLWIPCNGVNAPGGVEDSTDAARTYLKHETGNFFDGDRVDMFLKSGPEMVKFFETQTSVAFQPNAAFPDYHPDAPGAVSGGRSIVAAPIHGKELGEHIKELRPPLREITFVGMMFNASQEVQHFFKATQSARSFAYVVKRLASHAFETARYGRAMRLTNGNALAARLAKSAFEAGVQIRLSSPARRLLTDDKRVIGIMIDTPEGPRALHARRGVVLAAGGFPLDIERRKKLFTHAPTGEEHWSPAPPGNTGDGLRMAEAVGGTTEDMLPSAAALIPVSRVQHRDGTKGVFPHLIDRYKPGVIIVDQLGQRFVNEASSYHDVGLAMVERCRDMPETSAWLVCDQRALARYGLGYVKPFPVPHFHHLRSGYILKGRTIAELAGKAGINPAGLEQTIRELNVHARDGRDPEFGKGSTSYNRYLGDPEHKPNPCVAPLEKSPFYAIRMMLGDLGTFAGLKTDRHGRVLTADKQPVAGLFAVGNDMASIMGGKYPGGGITLGPAMTFGYVIGRYLAGEDGGLASHADLHADIGPTTEGAYAQ